MKHTPDKKVSEEILEYVIQDYSDLATYEHSHVRVLLDVDEGRVYTWGALGYCYAPGERGDGHILLGTLRPSYNPDVLKRWLLEREVDIKRIWVRAQTEVGNELADSLAEELSHARLDLLDDDIEPVGRSRTTSWWL